MLLAYNSLIRVSIQNYGLYTMEFFDLSILVWAFLSLVATSSQPLLLRDFSIKFMFPIFIFSVVLTRSLIGILDFKQFAVVKRYLIPDESKAREDLLNAYFNDHLLVFVPIFLYSVAQTIRSKQLNSLNSFLSAFGIKDKEANKGQVGYLTMAMKVLGFVVISTSRYISLVIGVFASLMSISLPNTVLLFLSLMFLGISKYDKALWKFYIYYSICVLLSIYVNNKLPYSIESFNLEVLSLLGLTRSKEICRLISRRHSAVFAVVFLRGVRLGVPSLPLRRGSDLDRRSKSAVPLAEDLQVFSVQERDVGQRVSGTSVHAVHGVDLPLLRVPGRGARGRRRVLAPALRRRVAGLHRASGHRVDCALVRAKCEDAKVGNGLGGCNRRSDLLPLLGILHALLYRTVCSALVHVSVWPCFLRHEDHRSLYSDLSLLPAVLESEQL